MVGFLFFWNSGCYVKEGSVPGHASSLQSVVKRPEVIFSVDPERYVVKNERPDYRTAVLFLLYRFNAGPLKEGDKIQFFEGV